MTLDRLRGDCVHTLRLLQRAPLYASVVAVTVGLAIGATTALFAIVHAVVLAPLPYPSPDRVVAVWETAPREGYATFRAAPGNVADWSTQNRVFEAMAMFGAETWQATGNGEPQQLQGAVYVRTDGRPSDVAAAVREAVRSIDPALPIVNMQTLEAHLAAALARPRFLFTVMVAFAVAALVLAALGVYGLLAYVVQQRRGEIAVRQALGATRQDLVRLVLGEGALLAVGGASTGFAAALTLGRSLSAVLYQVGPTDPVALTLAPTVILAVALVAALVPAWRAARVDAGALLRGD